MKVKIWPRGKNEKGGYACMPLAANIPNPRSSWKLVKCPECGTDCYETPLLRSVKKQQQLICLCTTCALKKGMRQ